MNDAPPEPSSESGTVEPWRFTTRDLLRAFVALAAICGVAAQFNSRRPSLILLIACPLIWIGIWCSFVVEGWRRNRLERTMVGVMPLIFSVPCFCVGFIAYENTGPRARRSECTNNLKLIGLGLSNYHDVYGCFPPAYTTDASGRRMHSWRVLILPWIGEQVLYNSYNLNEPWDGPNNRKLLTPTPSFYCCPDCDQDGSVTTTSYVAIVGPETAWPGTTSLRVGDIRDGTGQTILVVESHDAAIPWMKPEDLECPPLVPRINAQPGPSISSPHPPGGALAVLPDGSVRFLVETLTPAEVRALLTTSGGEPFSLD